MSNQKVGQNDQDVGDIGPGPPNEQTSTEKDGLFEFTKVYKESLSVDRRLNGWPLHLLSLLSSPVLIRLGVSIDEKLSDGKPALSENHFSSRLFKGFGTHHILQLREDWWIEINHRVATAKIAPFLINHLIPEKAKAQHLHPKEKIKIFLTQTKDYPKTVKECGLLIQNLRKAAVGDRTQKSLPHSSSSQRSRSSPSLGRISSPSLPFVTPQTSITNEVYVTASIGMTLNQRVSSAINQEESEYHKLLRGKSLFPVDPLVEKNWSGRGQHVEFAKTDRKIIQNILTPIEVLGSSSTAIVEAVRCRRIKLARKTIRCSRRFTKAQAVEEVAHLTRLQHSHIVQVIGTYTISNELSILLYPVAEYSLDGFFESAIEADYPWSMIDALRYSFACLASTVDYIHNTITKHMDIKPKNILMRNMDSSSRPHKRKWKPYIADFGIARNYTSLAASETDGPTMFTRKYAAPEVVDRQSRGLSADIFSLGCVFLEIKTVITSYIDRDRGLSKLQSILEENPLSDYSYSANIDALRIHFGKSHDQAKSEVPPEHEQGVFVIWDMLEEDPLKRPSASALKKYLCKEECCPGEGEKDQLEVDKCLVDEQPVRRRKPNPQSNI